MPRCLSICVKNYRDILRAGIQQYNDDSENFCKITFIMYMLYYHAHQTTA